MTERHPAFRQEKPRTGRHPAFCNRGTTMKGSDDQPHSLTPVQREHVLHCIEVNCRPSMYVLKKLLRLHDERTAACQHLMRQMNLIGDPELG